MKTNKPSILVAYFSHSGNTERVAKTLARLVSADLFEIQPVVPYPAMHMETLARARLELAEGVRPPLKPTAFDPDNYDIIAIGTPNWKNKVAPPVETLLRSYDWSGKIILPFCTHGGDGAQRPALQITQLCQGAEVTKPFALYGAGDCQLRQHLQAWLAELALPSVADFGSPT